MDRENLHLLSATEAACLIREGIISSEQLVEACLARICDVDPQVEAWAFLDPDHALAQARAADALRLSGQPIGALHGVPVAVKDIFDTADMPTECGSPIYAGRTPSRDATIVARLRAAGAVIIGKTVTTECGSPIYAGRTPSRDATIVARLRAAGAVIIGKTVTPEFAYFFPGKPRNPHNPDHTPGGSSSGSAAAVGANMVPLAIGSQTNGSTIRPAAYCGVVGFKPTHGLISRHRAFALSRTLDHVGLFARSVDDIALVTEQLTGYDENDPDTRPRARIPFSATTAEEPPLAPMFAFIKTPIWERADDDTKEGFAEIVEQLGEQVEEVELFPSARQAWDWHQTIMSAEMAINLEREWDKNRDRLSEQLRAQLERGRLVRAVDYQRALRQIPPVHEIFTELFEQRYDAILTPAAPSAAPKGLEGTGDPSFCTLWTLLGMPCVTLPLLQSAGDLPIGVQLVGPRGGDARLLRTARWLAARMTAV